ncbi:MAG: O-antigen ligase family protein, partial [Chloroflexota bacterium]
MGTEHNQNPKFQSLFTVITLTFAYLLCLWPNFYLTSITALMLLLGTIIYKLQNGLNLVNPLTLSLTIFIGSATLGVWSAYNTPQATTKLMILLVAALLSIYLFNTKKHNDEINVYLAIGSVVFSIASLGIPLFGIERGELLTPNRLAGLIAILTPFLLLTFVSDRSKEMRLLKICGLIIALIALIASGSRGGIVALAIGIGLWWLLAGKRSLRHQLRPSAVGIILSSIFLVGIAGLLIVSRLSSTALIRIPGSGSRLTLYANLQNLIPDYWLLGGGLNSFSGHYSQYILSIPHLRFTYGHNLYFDLILELGVIGLVSFCFLILICIVLLISIASNQIILNKESQETVLHFSGA